MSNALRQVLKECPFCGRNEQSIDEETTEGNFCIRCDYCSARGAECGTVEYAMREWNTRK